MFTGIIEAIGEVVHLESEGANLHISVRSPFANELKVDQSVAHNGVCLTVVSLDGDVHTVTAVQETLQRSSLRKLEKGDRVNLERGMRLGDRLDGHIVQGHVDGTALCSGVSEKDGSWLFSFQHIQAADQPTIEKGSITVDGVSLTVVDSMDSGFSVAIIPYTYGHTLFHSYRVGSEVNLEFDVIGKYVARLLQSRGAR